jgi:sorbitol-specific phosphotransferase system component IIBC
MKTKLILLSTILLFSCAGTRKVNKSDTKEETQIAILDTSKTETKTDTNIKVIDCTDTDEITIVPVDNTKEIIVNGKTYKNVYLKHRKVKNNITANKVEKVAKIEQKAVSVKEETKKSVAVKQTESTKGNFWNWVLLIICITAFIFFVIWSRKYVKKESGEL